MQVPCQATCVYHFYLEFSLHSADGAVQHVLELLLQAAVFNYLKKSDAQAWKNV